MLADSISGAATWLGWAFIIGCVVLSAGRIVARR